MYAHRSSPLLPTPASLTLMSFFSQLWPLRLSSLARLRLCNQASAIRTTSLALSLPSSLPPCEHVLPFDLDTIHAHVKYGASYAHGYADALGAFLRWYRCHAQGARVLTRTVRCGSSAACVWT